VALKSEAPPHQTYWGDAPGVEPDCPVLDDSGAPFSAPIFGIACLPIFERAMPGTADADPCGFGIAEAEPTSDDIVRLAEPKGADGPVFGTGVPMPELPPGFSAPGVGALLLVDWAKAGPPNARTSADAANVIFMMLSTVCRFETAFTLWLANGPAEVRFPRPGGESGICGRRNQGGDNALSIRPSCEANQGSSKQGGAMRRRKCVR